MLGKYAAKYGVPTLLITMLVGLLVGNGGDYDFDYNSPEITLRISEIALCFIIFSGGFDTNFDRFRPIILQGISLSTLGVIITTLLVGLFVHYALGMDWVVSLLLGAIFSSTDAAAVFSILESKQLNLKENTKEVLELESGTNDPMAYFLTFGLTAILIHPDKSFSSLFPLFFMNMGIGLLSGFLIGSIAVVLIRKLDLRRGLNPILLTSIVFFAYASNVIMGGSPFLSVYITGIIIGNAHFKNKEFSINFFDGSSWLMETILFLVLGLQVFITDLPGVVLEGLLVSVFLILFARPIGVFVSFLPFKRISVRKKLLVSWVGLRGATPIVFALLPYVQGVPDSQLFFNMAFVVVVSSILLQGSFIGSVAKALGMVKED